MRMLVVKVCLVGALAPLLLLQKSSRFRSDRR